MSGEAQSDGHVQGERDKILVRRTLSTQSRASNVLAISLMSLLGLGSLVWYYAKVTMRQGRVREHAQAVSAGHAQGDLPLPSLGRIDAPPLPDLFEPVSPPASSVGSSPQVPRTLTEIPIGPNSSGMPNGSPPPKTPEQLAQERELSGTVFSPHGEGPLATPQPATAARIVADSPSLGVTARDASDLGGLLRPTVIPAAHAWTLPTHELLLPKGAFIDCTLETAIDSSLPGMTTCITATDTFGVDGKVVLMDRGTKLIGETKGQIQQGASRVFVLWTEARTPAGVVVSLNSPGADELGRSGLPGEINRHFWQRFGAAMLVSVVDGSVQAAAQSSRGSVGAVIVNPQASQDVLTEILKNTIGIAPTVVKRNGDRIQVLVAQNLDFRAVYELRNREQDR